MAEELKNQETISLVQDVCSISGNRARELLCAGSGSVERAVEIHFAQSTPNTKRKPSVPPSSPSKQAKLSSFFSNGKQEAMMRKADEPANHQRKDSKLSPVVQRNETCGLHKMESEADDERVMYRALADAFDDMVSTTKRNAKLDSLQRLLSEIIHSLGGIGGDDKSRKNDAEILCRSLELMMGSTIKLQVSGSAVSKAVLEVTGVSAKRLREAYRETGDLGDAAEHFVRNQRLLFQPKPLSVATVYDALQQIASQEGKGSSSQRHALMVKLLRSSQKNEMRFLIRTLLGNMRLGASARSVLAALAMSIENLDAERLRRDANVSDAVKAVQDTFDFCPRLDKVSLALLCGGISHMKDTCVMEVGTPVNPMLANPAHSLEEVEKLMTVDNDGSMRVAVAEYKYDGMRCQVHFNGAAMTLFSRDNLKITDQFPDAVQAVLDARNESGSSFIMDSEIVGVEEIPEEPGAFRLLPFQDLSTRRGDAKKDRVRIRIFAFDLIYINGESLAKRPLWERQQSMRKHFHETLDFCFAESMRFPLFSEVSVREFLNTAVQGGAEGLMVKLTGEVHSNTGSDQTMTAGLECHYESGVRSQSWLKVKRDYVAGFADTIDVVPIGAWYGNGRKAQKKFLSPVLLAVYDEEQDVFRSICRCMSFTDAMYNAMREFYFRGTPYPDGVGSVGMDEDPPSGKQDAKDTEMIEANEDERPLGIDVGATAGLDEEWVNCYPSRPAAVVDTHESPPIWFKPMEVWEVSFADLTLSKTHTAAAGMVDSTRGVALRFPRFKRRRPDKSIVQATNTVQVAELFSRQTKQGKSDATRYI